MPLPSALSAQVFLPTFCWPKSILESSMSSPTLLSMTPSLGWDPAAFLVLFECRSTEAEGPSRSSSLRPLGAVTFNSLLRGLRGGRWSWPEPCSSSASPGMCH